MKIEIIESSIESSFKECLKEYLKQNYKVFGFSTCLDSKDRIVYSAIVVKED